MVRRASIQGQNRASLYLQCGGACRETGTEPRHDKNRISGNRIGSCGSVCQHLESLELRNHVPSLPDPKCVTLPPENGAFSTKGRTCRRRVRSPPVPGLSGLLLPLHNCFLLSSAPLVYYVCQASTQTISGARWNATAWSRAGTARCESTCRRASACRSFDSRKPKRPG